MMRKTYKLFLVLLICLLLFACAKGDEQITIIEDLPSHEASFENQANFSMTVIGRGHERDDVYIAEWSAYLLTTFDINVTINFIINNELNYMYDYSLELLSKKNTGMFFVESDRYKEFMGFAMEYNLLTDVGEFLQDNDTWKNLPNIYNQLYTEGNKLFGIPNSVEPIIYGRILNDAYMDTLDLAYPTNLSELANVLYQFTYGDPDQNGEDDTYGLHYKNAYEFMDIFNAYGVYLNFSYISSNGDRLISSVTYNPTTYRYEDTMLSSGATNALLYIDNLLSYGLCSKTSDNFLTGSYFGTTDEVLEGYQFSYKMLGEDENPIIPMSYVDKSKGAYFVSLNTEDADNIVNTFINVFYGSNDGNEIGANGIYTNNSDTLIPVICDDLFLQEDLTLYNQIQNSNNTYTILPLNYVSLVDYGSTSYRSSRRVNNFYSLFNKMFNDFVRGDISVSDAIEYYQTEANRLDIDELLERITDGY